MLIMINKFPKNIAIIGSGPISLFEAIYQAKRGNNVVVYEGRERYGGAWSNIKFNQKYDLELGCHIWDVDKGVYSFLESFLDQELKNVTPKPKILYKGRSFLYDWKNNVFLIKSLKKGLITFRFKSSIGKLVLFPRTYKYPKGGSLELMNKLIKTCKLNGVEMRKDTKVDLITEKKDGWTLSTDKTDEDYDELILTSFSGLKEVRGIKRNIIPELRKVTFTHYHFVVSDPNFKKKISYLRVMGHQFIHRVSDISDYSNIKNLKVLAVGVFKAKITGFTDAEIKLEIEQFLKQSKIVSDKAEVIDFFHNDYEINILENAEIKLLNQLPKLTILKSINFIYGVRANLERWKHIVT